MQADSVRRLVLFAVATRFLHKLNIIGIGGARKELFYKMGGFHCIKADFWDRFISHPRKPRKCINQKSNKQKRRKKDGKECKVF
jgi:hypothetical protein